MCGIAGIVSQREVSSRAALNALAHRGPDAEGEYRQGPVWLGHRRLSIIDLSAGGAQPMAKAGAGAIVFNGEIYDHRRHRAKLESRGIALDSSSDTEVLLRGLASEGMHFLRDVHGMYAFAWLEDSGNRLWLVRDHAGMKPLYYWSGGGALAFASEVRSLARAIDSLGGRPRLSGRGLASFLAWGAVQEPECILEGVAAVPPGCAIEVRLATGEVRCQSVAVSAVEDTVDREARVVEAVRSAVERHLEADVPVAVFLSSGLDSGVLAAEAIRLGGRVPTAITVELGSRGTSDEPELVERFAARLGMQLERVALNDWPNQLAGAVQAYDQPSIDGLNTYLVAASARLLGFKVALSGVGADEVFGGYAHLRSRVPDLRGAPGARLLARALGPRLEGAVSQKVRRAGALLDGALRDEPPARSWRRVISDRTIRALLPCAPRPSCEALPEDPLAIERETYLVNTLLRDTDVMGMAHGVEIRAPYLDPDVIRAAQALGARALLDPRRPPKWILRKNWGASFEPKGLQRKKTGFSLDLGAWLRAGSGREMVEQARAKLPRRSSVCGAEARALFEREWRRLDAGEPSAAHFLFAMIQLDLQLERWGEPA